MRSILMRSMACGSGSSEYLRTRRGWAILLSLVVMLAGSAARGSTSPETRPTTRPTTLIEQKDCVTSKCHANVKSTAVLHGPVATDNCDACHSLNDVRKHTFTVPRTKAELCTYCHEFSVAAMPVVHKPVTQGECLGCHDPHGGRTKAIVREASTAELCGRCHESITRNKSFLHGPVAKGECDSCHPPHASRFPKLLDVVGTDMCLTCHVAFEPAVSGARSQHKAMEKGCEKCHDVHGSNQPMALLQPAQDLCLGCHDKLKAKIDAATVKHSVVTKDRACLNCHASHASNVGKLLREPSAVSCLKCHTKEVTRSDGVTIAAVPEIADPTTEKHGEIRDGQCGGCHDVHGGTRSNLLVKPYARQLYQRFQPDDYALCFGCHDMQPFMQRRTIKQTNFRDGEVDLHYLHANRGHLDKNCRACHLTHAGPNPRIIRTELAFGKWVMPMRFKKTATGGSCFPGCHRELAYDRENPVASTTAPTSGATTEPATPAIARAQQEDTQKIHWSATDIGGASVTIPDGRRATALVMLSDDDNAGNDAVVAQLRSALPAETDAQVTIIISGKTAASAATTMAVKKATGWSIIADADHAAAEALGVR
ncbi:MAG TPA: cytochrome c3 family protein, partial [Tepidisphaeraceae bacterium]|nr:cytochrome c3 family protein [Tepidisphaeraceae bacterium]